MLSFAIVFVFRQGETSIRSVKHNYERYSGKPFVFFIGHFFNADIRVSDFLFGVKIENIKKGEDLPSWHATLKRHCMDDETTS